jgi:hypothetical protein
MQRHRPTGEATGHAGMVQPQVVLHDKESKVLPELCDVLRFRTEDQTAHTGVQPISPNYEVVYAR